MCAWERGREGERERTREDAQACSFDGVVSQWRFLCHKAGVCAYEREREGKRERERERRRKGALACSSDSVVSQRRLLCHEAGVRVCDRERERVYYCAADAVVCRTGTFSVIRLVCVC